jgi:hypothetical protein
MIARDLAHDPSLHLSAPDRRKGFAEANGTRYSDDACADPLTQLLRGDTDRADVAHSEVRMKLIVLE